MRKLAAGTRDPPPTNSAGRVPEGCRRAAERIKAAYDLALDEDRETRDLGGDLGTEAFADAVIERLAD